MCRWGCGIRGLGATVQIARIRETTDDEQIASHTFRESVALNARTRCGVLALLCGSLSSP